MNGSGDLGEMISKITENPEMMNTLKMMAGNMMAQNGENVQQKSRPSLPDECIEESVPKNKKRGSDADNLICLLLALKPYVSDERCEKIDSVVKILKLVQLSEKTGLLKSFL